MLARNGITRGHSLKLEKDRFRLNVRGHFFTERIINLWNQLKEETVSATNLNGFKNKLDAEWDYKEWKYNRNVPVV